MLRTQSVGRTPGGLARLAAASLLFFAGTAVAKAPRKPAKVPAAVTVPAAPPAAPSPLVEAQACYGTGDLGCVLRVLATADVPAAEASERLRLLGFSAARLDRHTEARTWFAQWVALAPGNRLDRAVTPPVVYQDYSAALLASRSADLEWTPQVDHQTLVLPTAPTPADFAQFAPPPRGQGMPKLTIRYGMGVHASLPVSSQAGAWSLPWRHVGMQLAMDLAIPLNLSVGAVMSGWQRPDPTGGVTWNPSAVARLGWGQRFGNHGLEVFVGAGVALATGKDSVVGALVPAVRYHWRPEARVAGFYAELASQTLFGSDATSEVLGLSLGVLLQPLNQ